MAVRFGRCLRIAIFGFGFIICFSAQTLFAVLRIEPAYLEVPLDKGRPSGVFILSNVGDTEERWRIKAIHFTFTVDGALNQSKTGEYSLAPWIYFNPREVRLPPKTRRAVRFTIVPRGRLQEGEYWAAMEMESLKLQVATIKDEETGRTISVAAATSVLVPIFGTVGKASYKGLVKEVKLTNNNGVVSLRALVAATGTGRLRVNGKYEILNATGEIVNEGPFGGNAFICRGAERWIKTKLEVKLPEETYTVKLALNSIRMEKPIIKLAKVTWPKIQPEAEDDDIKTAVNKSKDSDNQTGGSKEATNTNREDETEPTSVS